MARGSRRGRRREEAEEIPVAEPMEERGRGGRGLHGHTRAPSGPDFALKVGLGAGLVAGILAFAGVLVMDKVAGTDSSAVMDLGGVQAVRALAAIDTDRWSMDFGTTRAVRAKMKRGIDDQLAAIEKAGDSRDVDLVRPGVAEFWAGKAGSGAGWRPGVDMYLPKNDPTDLAIDAARRRGLQRVQGQDKGALSGMAVINLQSEAIVSHGELFAGAVPVAQYGETQVLAARGLRVYEHPTVNRADVVSGKAIVQLRTEQAVGANVMGTAGAAGGLAFLGAFMIGFLMCLAPVKAFQRLAGEVDAIAHGDYGGRITMRGPPSALAVARGVQRLANLAAEGGGGDGGGGEPQVIQETVHVLPIDEINTALAASKSFERVDALEIESTHKSCPDSGNDYHDVINLPGGKVGLFVADIPVRGLPGAMYMARVSALFRAAAAESDSPAEVLKAVNRGFAIDLPRGVYVTAMYVIADPESGVCKVANAQHLPLVFWKLAKKGSARLQTQGIALGHDAGPVFDKSIEEKAIKLERGDRIVLFSDGAITAKNAAGAIYGEERFYYVVNREAPKNSAAFVNFVANDVDLFHEGGDQLDDFTIVTARKVK